MSVYKYKAKDRRGNIIEAAMDAVSTEAVANFLLDKKLAIIDIRPQVVSGVWYWQKIFFFNRVSNKDLVIFFRQLAVMVEANIPLVRGLRILVRQTKNDYLRNVIDKVADEVEGGSSFSSALEVHPDIFTKFYVNIMRSGETSGRLSEVMNYLADQKEKDYDLESKVRGAMIYPAMIVLVLGVVGFIVVAFVIPGITKMLIESGAQIPLITQIMMNLANFLRNFWWLVVLTAVGLLIIFFVGRRTPEGRRFLDLVKLKIPIFGAIFKDIYIVRFAQSFATLIKGGVPIAQGLAVVKEVVDNKMFEEMINNAIGSVNEGNQISESLAASPYLPQIVANMISVGEESGKLEEVLDKAADFYSKEIDNSVRNLSNLIEPIIMIFLGIAVALFVIAVLLPMWQLSSAF
ncbi:MAG: type II secretion system F family protein [Candidatus Buchananbacteria bacterium]